MAINNYINEIERIFSKRTFNKEDVTHVMTQLRLTIEETNSQEKYKYLNLYCNWTLHTKISGSNTALRILELLTDAIIAHNKDTRNAKHISDAIIEGLSLHKALTDLMNLSAEHNIKSTVKFSDIYGWLPFASVLVEVLMDKPLIFPTSPSGTTKTIYDSIMTKAVATGNPDVNAVISAQFTRLKSDPGIQLIEIFTPATIAKGVQLVAQMAYVNQGMVDALENNQKI